MHSRSLQESSPGQKFLGWIWKKFDDFQDKKFLELRDPKEEHQVIFRNKNIWPALRRYCSNWSIQRSSLKCQDSPNLNLQSLSVESSAWQLERATPTPLLYPQAESKCNWIVSLHKKKREGTLFQTCHCQIFSEWIIWSGAGCRIEMRFWVPVATKRFPLTTRHLALAWTSDFSAAESRSSSSARALCASFRPCRECYFSNKKKCRESYSDEVTVVSNNGWSWNF